MFPRPPARRHRRCPALPLRSPRGPSCWLPCRLRCARFRLHRARVVYSFVPSGPSNRGGSTGAWRDLPCMVSISLLVPPCPSPVFLVHLLCPLPTRAFRPSQNPDLSRVSSGANAVAPFHLQVPDSHARPPDHPIHPPRTRPQAYD
ncbi:hypothetical protein C8Q78DRAFT_1001566 [Trametes maxima]|nr:hypothetical protein C8Q78DRAFT_1001566 [Trametes maxima]